jgi:outer membrane lipoprotein-sorting protein
MRLMRVWIVVLVAFFGSIAVPAAGRAAEKAVPGGPDVPADAVSEARRVQEALNGVKGLVASFTQTVESAGLPRPQVEKGTVYLMRPGRMRWEYEVPRGKLAIADGRRTYLYLPEERQVLVAPLDPDAARTGISILLNRVDLVSSFAITWGPGPERGPRPLLLTPRAPRRNTSPCCSPPGPTAWSAA